MTEIQAASLEDDATRERNQRYCTSERDGLERGRTAEADRDFDQAKASKKLSPRPYSNCDSGANLMIANNTRTA